MSSHPTYDEVCAYYHHEVARRKEAEAEAEKYKNRCAEHDRFAEEVVEMVVSVTGVEQTFPDRDGAFYFEGHQPLPLVEFVLAAVGSLESRHTYARWVGSKKKRRLQIDCDGGRGAKPITLVEVK